jgi:hypothetical protein
MLVFITQRTPRTITGTKLQSDLVRSKSYYSIPHSVLFEAQQDSVVAMHVHKCVSLDRPKRVQSITCFKLETRMSSLTYQCCLVLRKYTWQQLYVPLHQHAVEYS